ncbi:DUF554 domain-containing protein [Zobellia sp.]|nr:DUF554 domain-containing protein [Zobellia sp.]
MFKKLPIGTLINVVAVVIGSSIGLLLQESFPESIKTIIFQAIGLGILLIGIMMSLKLPDGVLLHLIFSLIIGGIIGQLIGLDVVFANLGDNLKAALDIKEEGFTQGLITAFLIFCIGSMTIVGAIEEGISGKKELLLVKSLLDGITSIALASSFGVGVLFSVIPLLIFQGGITLLAKQAQKFFNEKMVLALSATGGLLIVALSINILQIGKLTIENLLPAIVIMGVLVWGEKLMPKKFLNF